jgi:rSAM/selenodomain-associated transferase 2
MFHNQPTMQRNRISIIIPTLNESKVIVQTLSSLQPFRVRGHEVIIVDGGSHDNTRGLVSGLVDRVLAAPAGRASQMSAGVAAATGQVIWFLHADTVPPAQADHLILSAMERGIWGRFDVRLSGRRLLLRIVERFMNLRSRLTGIATGDQGIFVRRKALDSIGGLPFQELMEDIELSRRLKRVGRPICMREQVITSSRRWEEKGVLSTMILMWRLRFAYALGTDPGQLARRYDAGT